MTNFDLLLAKIGLCRIGFYNKMKLDFGKVINMKSGQVRRVHDKNLQLTIELAQVRTDLDNAQKLLSAKAYIRDAG